MSGGAGTENDNKMMGRQRFTVMMGRRLRVARISVGMTQAQFADELGLDPQDYARIECGDDAPDLVTLVYASRFTGKSIDFLVTGSNFVPI